MKNIIILSISILLSICSTPNSHSQNLTFVEKEKLEKEVDSVFKLAIKTAEKLDYDKLSKGVDDSNNAGFIAGNSYYSRFDSLVNLIKARAGGVLKQSISLKKEKITILSETIALVVATGDSKIIINGGSEFATSFCWTFVYEKINGMWKVIQSHQSSQRQ
jgi:hypothetical protein